MQPPAFGRCGPLLLRLVRDLVELGGDPRQVFDRPVQLFEIDRATARAGDAVPRYQPSDSYADVSAPLRCGARAMPSFCCFRCIASNLRQISYAESSSAPEEITEPCARNRG